MPEFSLAVGVLNWCNKYIRQPDGPDAGKRFRFTTEQKRFLWYYYAVDRTGRFLWSRATLRRAKGWGKSPYLAAIALAELCGPVRFSHFDKKTDEAIGKPVSLAWVQIAGVSEKQTANTMSMVLAMVAESPIIEDYGLDIGLTRIYTSNGGKLEPITASAPTAEGARPSFVVLDETHLWIETNGGHKLGEVIRRNLGKSRDGAARSIETTNAYEMGQDSVAERTHKAWLQQSESARGRVTILYDSRESSATVDFADESTVDSALEESYGDSHWVDHERIKDEIYDPSNPASQSRRFYFNQLVADEDAWLSPQEWDALMDKTKVVLEDEEITLGFDGSKNDDHTVLIGCRVSDSHIFVLGIWDPKEYGGEAPRLLIDTAVKGAFEFYDVVGMVADVAEWQSYIDAWEEKYSEGLCVKATPRHSIAYDMRGNKLETVRLIENMHDAIVEGACTHDGNKKMAQHFYNARRRNNQYGLTIAKETPESPNKIDAAVGAALARKARQDYLALPESKRRRRRTGAAAFA